MQLGLDAIDLGAGRRTREDKIDPVSGIEIHKRIGDKIDRNDLIFRIHSNDKDAVKNIERKIESRLELSEETITKKKLIIEKI
jgi:pyrimidine-nucleoside phosphorylase